MLPQAAHQRPSINAGDADHAVPGQIGLQRTVRAKIARQLAQIPHDEAGQMRMGAFQIFQVDPIIADLGVGHRDDLAPVAGVGEDFLITGHGSVEANFAVDFAGCTETNAGINRAVFQGQLGSCAHVLHRSPGKLPVVRADGAPLKFQLSAARYAHYGCGSLEQASASPPNPDSQQEGSCPGEQGPSIFLRSRQNAPIDNVAAAQSRGNKGRHGASGRLRKFEPVYRWRTAAGRGEVQRSASVAPGSWSLDQKDPQWRRPVCSGAPWDWRVRWINATRLTPRQ